MAIYIPIRKETEDALIVTYLYGVERVSKSSPVAPSRSRIRFNLEYAYGRIVIDKISGSVKLIEVALGDENQGYFERAAQKLIQHWKDGELPDDTCWAS